MTRTGGADSLQKGAALQDSTILNVIGAPGDMIAAVHVGPTTAANGRDEADFCCNGRAHLKITEQEYCKAVSTRSDFQVDEHSEGRVANRTEGRYQEVNLKAEKSGFWPTNSYSSLRLAVALARIERSRSPVLRDRTCRHGIEFPRTILRKEPSQSQHRC